MRPLTGMRRWLKGQLSDCGLCGAIVRASAIDRSAREALRAPHGLYERRTRARKTIDKRTDVWAFGCVLYEMLTAPIPFSGDTVSVAIAAILAREPDWRSVLLIPQRLPSC